MILVMFMIIIVMIINFTVIMSILIFMILMILFPSSSSYCYYEEIARSPILQENHGRRERGHAAVVRRVCFLEWRWQTCFQSFPGCGVSWSSALVIQT